MLVKAVLLFLLVLAAIGWIGSLLGRPVWRDLLASLMGRKRVAAYCPACGRPRVGPGRCPCGKA